MAEENKLKIAFVDDEESLLSSIADYFSDLNIHTFSRPEKALESMKEVHYDILVTDYRMPCLSGLELLLEARRIGGYSYGILLTAFADKNLLEEALNNHLVKLVIEKPLKLKLLKKSIDEAMAYCLEKQARESREEEVRQKYQELQEHSSDLEIEVIGLNGGLKEVFENVKSVVPYDVPVMLTGETGTGKEVIARLIHRLSSRKDKTFIEVNCTAIPENLLESELFGYEKGAFTGADKNKPGKIELAHEGTLFLDEIGDMRIDLQTKLLRVLQEKTLVPLGGVKKKLIDFRLIAATNKNIEKAMEVGEFREDLYYRINTFPISLPTLNCRRQDIKELTLYYVNRYCHEMKMKPVSMSSGAISFIEQYNWRGNIRELKNAIQRALIICAGKNNLEEEDFRFLTGRRENKGLKYEDIIAAYRDRVIQKKLDMKDLEKDVIQSILEYYDNNVKLASEMTGISLSRFYRSKKGGE